MGFDLLTYHTTRVVTSTGAAPPTASGGGSVSERWAEHRVEVGEPGLYSVEVVIRERTDGPITMQVSDMLGTLDSVVQGVVALLLPPSVAGHDEP